MSLSPVSQILRAANHKPGDTLNILDWVTHERYQPNLARTGHNFVCFPGEHVRVWNEKYSEIPRNYAILDKPELTISRDYDIILSQNPEVHMPMCVQLQRQLHAPIINIMHTMPAPNYNEQLYRERFFNSANHHVFISEFSRAAWGFSKDENTTVIKHGMDLVEFSPAGDDRENKVLVVANDYINRNWALGFGIFQEIVLKNEIPYTAIGDTPGFSLPSRSTQDVIDAHRSHRIFLNTSTFSPVPMSLLEAMSCSCAVVSTATCMMPDIIKHGHNGLLFPANKPEKGLELIKQLMEDEDMAEELGKNARKTMEAHFDISRFIDDWNSVFEKVVDKGYLL